MIIILNQKATEEKIKELVEGFHAQGLKTNVSQGSHTTIVGLIGDTTVLDIDNLKGADYVADVKRVSEPYKKANRKMHPEDSLIKVTDDVTIGSGIFNVIAGPCSVETEEQIIGVAEDVKKSGATLLRGGAFKPRTSPYSFQGLGGDGLKLLLEAKKATGLPIVTELMNLLLKRGLANTIEEWLMSAEYIMAGGNENVILCERGIRTFETATRNTLDISAVPMLKKLSHLPVVIDPSHATGLSWMVAPLAKTAVAAGADGLMIEVHNDPPKALCDGAQSLNPVQFDELMQDIKRRVEFEGKRFGK